MWARGHRLVNPQPVLILYSLCKEFKTLPESGGLYNQAPELLSAFSIIVEEVHKAEDEKAKQLKRQSKHSPGKARRI